MQVPCSRSAHDQNVLARRPQWDQHGCHSKREMRASLEGSLKRMRVFDARSKGQPWPLPYREMKRIGRPSLGLMTRPGRSIAKQSEGRAGEKCLPVGGRVKKLRAVEDQSAPIPEEITSELGGINCNLARRPQLGTNPDHLSLTLILLLIWARIPSSCIG